MPKAKRNFNYALFKARKERGWTQEELAEAAGVSKGTIAAVESGQTVPTVTTAIRIARALGELVETLFGGVEH
jgi:putative transcriptional regulator